MKTTFKTVFNELDDELMELDIRDNASDIDIDKIKNEVLMQINSEKSEKKKFSKLQKHILSNLMVEQLIQKN